MTRGLLARSAALAMVIVAASLTTIQSPARPDGAEVVVDPVREVQNLIMSTGRSRRLVGPSYLAGMVAEIARYQSARKRIDRDRHPDPNACTTIVACPIDPRLADWAQLGGVVHPVLYTARSGATLSGHVWATRLGPDRRPAVLIVNGSILGLEQVYWFAAQALARAGFVVMTFDVQGEGMSDQLGAVPDRLEGSAAGTPLLSLPQTGSLGGSGTPFYDGGQDSLDFLLSTPEAPYLPRPSRSSNTSHAEKQERRASAGLSSSHNPLWRLVDPTRVGIAGHSYGAVAATWLAQHDARLDAAVAWDTLCVPEAPAPDEATAILGAEANRAGGLYGLPAACFGAPPGPAPGLRAPTLGFAGDYLLAPQPYLITPDPMAKSRASLAFTRAGVDVGQIVLRGGTHLDFFDVPLVPATERGIDVVTWYTTAWFLKYLAHDPAADRMLTTRRWNDDERTRRSGPSRDGNVFSFHYESRLDIIRADGSRFRCDDLRRGCRGQTPAEADCGPARYGFVPIAKGVVDANRCRLTSLS